MKLKKPSFLCLLGAVTVFQGLSSTASAMSLLLDFGSTPGIVADAQAANSPAHATGAVPATERTWNLVTTADISSGLLFSNNTAATGISLNIAVETAIGSNILDFNAANSVNSTSLTGSFATSLGSIYGTATADGPAKDGIFRNNTGNADNAAIGFRLDGLAAGTYTIYYIGRNTNTATVRPQAFYTAVGNSSSTFNFTGLTGTTLSNSLTSGNDTFIAGDNYNSVTFTIETGQSFFFAAEGTTGTEGRGFLNTIEIVQVPEPSVALLGAASAGLMLVRRKRRV